MGRGACLFQNQGVPPSALQEGCRLRPKWGLLAFPQGWGQAVRWGGRTVLGALWGPAVPCPAPSCRLPGGLTPPPQPGQSPHLHGSRTAGLLRPGIPSGWTLLARGSAQALANLWQEVVSGIQRGGPARPTRLDTSRASQGQLSGAPSPPSLSAP